MLTRLAQRLQFPYMLAFVLCALVLGGASRGAPFYWTILQLASLPLLAGAFLLNGGIKTLGISRLAYMLILACFAIPALQLVPLPSPVWSTLPGRAEILSGVLMAGGEPAWLPISLAPFKTEASLLWLLVPAALFFSAARLTLRQRRVLTGCVLLAVTASVVLGLAQLSEDGAGFRLYAETHQQWATGFFANKNHHAALLLAVLPLTAALGIRISSDFSRARAIPRSAAFGALGFVFSMGIAASGSRAGVSLALPATLGIVAMLVVSNRRSTVRAVLFPICAVTALSIAAAPLADRWMFSRFSESTNDLRWGAAPIVLKAAESFSPVGSGLGSFDAVYRQSEPTRLITDRYLNNAHNDYLELWLEAGIPAVLAILIFLIWWSIRSFQVWRPSSPWAGSAMPRASSIVVGLLLLHSLVDYPLRTPALAAIFALACALLETDQLIRASDRTSARIPR